VEWDNGHKSFPTGPHIWRDTDDGRVECIGVGSIDGKERRERICSMPKNYRWNEEATNGGKAAEAEATPAAVPVEEELAKQEDLADKVGKVTIADEVESTAEPTGKEPNGKPVEISEKVVQPLDSAIPTTVV
jgi:hypothetical protein